MATYRGAFLATLLLLLALVGPSTAYMRVHDGRFVDENCNDFTFVGANAWRVLEGQAGTTGVQLNGVTPTEWVFQTAAQNNISVIRMFAIGVTDELPLQISPGQYNEKALKALDETLDLAAKYGVMVTLILARTWQGPNAVANYASWTGTPIDNFFGDPDAINAFLEHITFMANRTNTVNGKLYKDDATIFSWNLMNEPRYFGNASQCQSDPVSCADTFNTWIKTTSDHLKGSDPNHLVAIGTEGFFGPNSSYTSANPSGGWAEKTGQDFERNTANPSIDYAVAHLWPDNWDVAGNEQFMRDWIQRHMDAAKKLGVPLHLEEFGKNTTNPFDPNDKEEGVRRSVFSLVYGELQDSLKAGNVLRAASYWMFDPSLQSANSNGFEDYGQDQVPTTSFTFTDIIVPAAKATTQTQGSAMQGCTPGTAQVASSKEQSSAGRKLRFWSKLFGY